MCWVQLVRFSLGWVDIHWSISQKPHIERKLTPFQKVLVTNCLSDQGGIVCSRHLPMLVVCVLWTCRHLGHTITNIASPSCNCPVVSGKPFFFVKTENLCLLKPFCQSAFLNVTLKNQPTAKMTFKMFFFKTQTMDLNTFALWNYCHNQKVKPAPHYPEITPKWPPCSHTLSMPIRT